MNALILAAALCAQAAPGPARSVLVSADGRRVFGWLEGGLIRFYPAEQTPENLAAEAKVGAVGANLANGVQAEGLHHQQAGTFTTNDPAFDPSRCRPDPAADEPAAFDPAPIACGLAAALIFFVARRRARDHEP